MEPIEIFRLLNSPAPQQLSYTATAANGTALADTSKVTFVKVKCTTDAYISIGNSVTATSSSHHMTAGIPDYFKIGAGDRVSAIRDTADGVCHVSFLAK